MYAILDIETTGGNTGYEKITEIAIYIHDGNRIVDEFATRLHETPIEAGVHPQVFPVAVITKAPVF